MGTSSGPGEAVGGARGAGGGMGDRERSGQGLAAGSPGVGARGGTSGLRGRAKGEARGVPERSGPRGVASSGRGLGRGLEGGSGTVVGGGGRGGGIAGAGGRGRGEVFGEGVGFDGDATPNALANASIPSRSSSSVIAAPAATWAPKYGLH